MAKAKKKVAPRRRAVASPRSNSHLPKFDRVLVVSAHPDDPDFGAGGSIARLADSGATVTYVIVTDGSQGGEDPAQKDSELKTIRDLVAWLRDRDEGGRLAFADLKVIRAAADQEHVPLDHPLAGISELALFPPVTGG